MKKNLLPLLLLSALMTGLSPSVLSQEDSTLTSDSENSPNSQSQIDVKATAEAETEATSEAETEATAEAETETTPEAETETTPEAETEATPEAETEATPEVVTEVMAEEELAKEPPKPNSFNLTNIGAITLLLTLLCLLVTTVLLLKEVRWRKRHLKNESIVFPDAHLDVLEDLKRAWEGLYMDIQNYSNASLSFQKQNESLSEQTISSISQFNVTIDDQKKEIERLKEGYDFSIKKHSITPLIEIHELLNKFLNEDVSDETKDKLKKVRKYVEGYLEELDVEEFTLEQGQSFRELLPAEYEIDQVELTSDETFNELIKETVANGYVFVHENGRNIIKKAKITVYKMENEDG
ncbi:hypothetical protein OAC45_03160 [Gammaproteobacteria bacterium]|nr:hypothetical protein [Gammaproteobacteria bacterium]